MRRRIVYITDPTQLLAPETFASTTSAFFLSHDIRRDVRFYIATESYTILLDGSTIRLLRPDAQSTRGLLRKVQNIQASGSGRMPRGFSMLQLGYKPLITRLPNSLLLYPAQRGRFLAETRFHRRDPALIVGADRGKALEAAEACHAEPIRLSRWPLPPNHEIVLFNILLDRMGMNHADSTDS